MSEPRPAQPDPPVEIVVAVSDNGVIGRDGDLPWRLPEDLRRFKRLTLGHALIMGRRTFESIGRPLPERRNIVLSRAGAPGGRGDRAGVEVAGSLEEALALAGPGERRFVIGGAGVFADALPIAAQLHVTRVHARILGDVAWPGALPWACKNFDVVEREHRERDERNDWPMTFLRLIRRD